MAREWDMTRNKFDTIEVLYGNEKKNTLQR